jgi:hypothetical protein
MSAEFRKWLKGHPPPRFGEGRESANMMWSDTQCQVRKRTDCARRVRNCARTGGRINGGPRPLGVITDQRAGSANAQGRFRQRAADGRRSSYQFNLARRWGWGREVSW